ncbi:GAF domain-containing protein [Fulvivirga ulvae]|uniref:GAF domain-containing protein n=1 Tax=Fulvivirga ulvae TaxID=2904245 RepID=UPI001F3F5163|nr:GAF domain-containing protein [Fulvivirga ulvae]UII34063.1 GAF domain-containing protein [Fulvivirga ulvae]
MTKSKVNLLGKFAITSVLLILTVLAIFYAAYFQHERIKSRDREIYEEHIPTLLLLKGFEALLFESLDTDIAQHAVVAKYSSLKKDYKKHLASYWRKDEKSRDMISAFDAMLISREELIKLRSTEEFVASQLTQISVNDTKGKIDKQVSQLKKMLEGVIQAQERKVSSVVVEKESADGVLVVLVILLLLTFIAGCLFLLYQLYNGVLSPLTQLRDLIIAISEGKSINTNIQIGQDKIMTNALVNLVKDHRARTSFAVAIGKGDYNNSLELRSEDDEMGKALLEMKENLIVNAKEEKQRNWTVSGLAKFADIIRSQTDLQSLGDTVISEMVKYTSSNQGALFIVEDEDLDDPYLRMASCYAWDKKRFVNKEIRPGQGLTGECWQEGDPIFITEIPQDYVRITSGLGDATPGCVFISPLKINENIYGILELATFKPYEEYEREFIIKVSENIAAAIFNARINSQTHKLLELSQQQAEEMRASEEELRQNMEELQATQEAAERRNAELERVNAQTEAQKQTMAKMLEKLKRKDEETEQQTQQLKAKEEEMLKRMNELEVVREMAEKRNKELERANAQAEAQKQSMTRMIGKLREKEKENQEQTEALKAQEEELRQSMEELKAVQEEMEKTRKAEASKSVEVQKKITEELTAKLRTAEEEVKQLRSMNRSQN